MPRPRTEPQIVSELQKTEPQKTELQKTELQKTELQSVAEPQDPPTPRASSEPRSPEVLPMRVSGVLHRVPAPRVGSRGSRTEPVIRRFGFTHTINPYRGCAFACRYCYARYTHEWLGFDGAADFDQRLRVKLDFAATLSRELRRLATRRAVGSEEVRGIAIGTATDPYQPIEQEYGLTRAALQVFAEESGWPIELTTKSNLILRDLPLLKKIAKKNSLTIHVTITTLDRGLARGLEPGAPSPRARIEAIAALTEAGIRVVPFVSPLMPGVNDRTVDLEDLFRELSQVGVTRAICEAVFLRSPTREVFLEYLERERPDQVERYRRRFEESAYLSPVEVERLRAKVDRLRRKFGLSGAPAVDGGNGRPPRAPRRGGARRLPSRRPPVTPETAPQQLGLFS